MPDLPTGTVTFLYTDIEGSTLLAQQFPAELPDLLARHHAILHQAIQVHYGHVFQITGDAFCAAFHTAADALKAALDAQRGLQQEAWHPAPIKARMGLHTGSAQAGAIEERAGGYVGYLTLTRVQRVMSTAHGGQVLLSNPTAELVRGELPTDVSLRDTGEHRLKGLLNPEHLWQLVAPDLRQDFPPLQSLNAIPNNLPVQLTSFIGREKDIAEVKRLLSAARLVTLTGSGGAGKTRLSLQVAAEVIDTFDNGVWFVELAPLTDPALIPQTVASMLGLREEQGRPLMTVLTDYLRAKTALIIFDNCEHLIEGCAQFADTVLRAAPQVKILASSREAFNIGGVATYRVPSLAAPDPQHMPSLEALTQYDAVRLFIERAKAVMPSFEVNDANAPAVAQLCFHLDGIPLALELAAARVRGLKVEQIAQRLDDRFRLLTGGGRTALPRQQTLRATIDWSHGLLTEQERILFRRLSVFAGGWTIEAAESVCAGDGVESSDIFDLLLHLMDKSLILMDEHSDETRHHMLETIREYAREKLLDSGEVESLRNRHWEYFIDLARQADPKLRGPEQKAWVERLTNHIDNIRAALEWSLESGQVVKGLELAGELDRFWWFYNSPEDRRWLEVVLQHPASQGRTPIRAKALCVAAQTSGGEGRYATARAYAEESVEIWHEHGDKRGLASALGWLGLQQGILGDFHAARSLATESIALFRETDDRWGLALSLRFLGNWPSEDGDYAVAYTSLMESLALFREIGDQQAIGTPLAGLGDIATRQGDYSAARRWFEEALAMRRDAGETWGIAFVHQSLGWVARLESDYRSAITHLRESLTIGRELGNIRLISDALYEIAIVATWQDRMERAARLFGATAELMKITGRNIGAYDQDEYKNSIDAMRAELDEATFDAAWKAGQEMTPEEAVAYALEASDG
jgi:predicted ATPase/class 3 adenylate cyclase